MDVKCRNCKQIYFETTDKYNPDVLPNGAMLQCKPKYKKMGWDNWLPVGKGRSNIMYSGIVCPQCKSPLVVKGRLMVVPDAQSKIVEIMKNTDTSTPEIIKNDRYCPICDKEFKNAQGLKAHATQMHKDKN